MRAKGLRNPPQSLRNSPPFWFSCPALPIRRYRCPEIHGAVDVFLCQTAGLGRRGCIWFRYASCGGLLRLLLSASCLHLLLLGASCLHLLRLRRRSFGLIYGAPDIACRFLAVGSASEQRRACAGVQLAAVMPSVTTLAQARRKVRFMSIVISLCTLGVVASVIPSWGFPRPRDVMANTFFSFSLGAGANVNERSPRPPWRQVDCLEAAARNCDMSDVDRAACQARKSAFANCGHTAALAAWSSCAD